MAATDLQGEAQAFERLVVSVHADAVSLPADVLLKELRGVLGAKLVAYLGRVKETRAVRQWADGERAPSSDVLRRLRTAYQAAALLSKRDSPGVVQAWFQGLNPVLQDCSPAALLRDGDPDTDGAAVLAAAKAFAATG